MESLLLTIHSTSMLYISMSQKELYKYEVVQRSIRKDITVQKAGALLRLTERQIYYLKVTVKARGAMGIIHGNRNKPSNRRVQEQERGQIARLLHARYSDFNPTHAREKLRDLHGIKRDSKTIRQIMIDEKLWKPRERKKTTYRALRPRKEHYGEMQQFDGSYHHWLEDRGNTGELCLLAALDYATRRITYASFSAHEGVMPVFVFWQEYIT